MMMRTLVIGEHQCDRQRQLWGGEHLLLHRFWSMVFSLLLIHDCLLTMDFFLSILTIAPQCDKRFARWNSACDQKRLRSSVRGQQSSDQCYIWPNVCLVETKYLCPEIIDLVDQYNEDDPHGKIMKIPKPISHHLASRWERTWSRDAATPTMEIDWSPMVGKWWNGRSSLHYETPGFYLLPIVVKYCRQGFTSSSECWRRWPSPPASSSSMRKPSRCAQVRMGTERKKD